MQPDKSHEKSGLMTKPALPIDPKNVSKEEYDDDYDNYEDDTYDDSDSNEIDDLSKKPTTALKREYFSSCAWMIAGSV